MSDNCNSDFEKQHVAQLVTQIKNLVEGYVNEHEIPQEVGFEETHHLLYHVLTHVLVDCQLCPLAHHSNMNIDEYLKAFTTEAKDILKTQHKNCGKKYKDKEEK